MREFTRLTTESDKLNLALLADATTSVEQYREALTQLGHSLAVSFIESLRGSTPRRICVACTVEDADSLAKGMVDTLESKGFGELVRISCFWNGRVEVGGLSVAPILMEYKEPCDLGDSVLIVVKSIISSACVVRTNLSNLIANTSPKRIFVVAPVMFKGADKSLECEFEQEISSRFEYLTLAVDDEKHDGKWVVPGVGGDIYTRLGYGGLENKNNHVPLLVKARRQGPLLAA